MKGKARVRIGVIGTRRKRKNSKREKAKCERRRKTREKKTVRKQEIINKTMRRRRSA